MKKLISFAVAVLMLLTMAVPMAFAADHEVAGTAETKGSVVGLTVDGEAVTSSGDYIAKMGYDKPENGWTEVNSVAGFKAMSGKGGYFYLSADIDFETEIFTTSYIVSPKGEYVLDGCGYTLKNLKMETKGAACPFNVGASTPSTIKNLNVGESDKWASIIGAADSVSALAIANLTGTFSVDNVKVWASVKTTTSQVAGIVCYTGKSTTLSITNCEMNGEVIGENMDGYGSAGIATRCRGTTTISNCVNNATVYGNIAGGIYGRQADGVPTISNCVNNGTIVSKATDGNLASPTYVTNGISGSNKTNAKETNCVNTGMITYTQLYGTPTTVVPTGVNAPKAYLQETEEYMIGDESVTDLRFILSMKAEDFEAAKADLEFKVSFRLTDGTDISKNFNEIVAFETVETDDYIYNAADGVVFCGVIVTGVVKSEWERCGISYAGKTWTADNN